MPKRLVSARYAGYYPFDTINGVNRLAVSDNPNDLREDDILVVWGGGDIHPQYYNEPRSKYSGAGSTPSYADEIEWALMQRSVSLGVPIIGVCRGAQMLCALAGGKLIQHVNGHGGYHLVETHDKQSFRVNSIHHQMMYPFEVDHQMIAWVPSNLSDVHYMVDESVPMPVEPEFVYFPSVKGFAIQWHPEMMDETAPATEYVLNFINQHISQEVNV